LAYSGPVLVGARCNASPRRGALRHPVGKIFPTEGRVVMADVFRSVRSGDLPADSGVRRARDLRSILSGGYCTRWHADPDMAHIRETLAEHHARVAQIILALHPSPTLALIDAALHHDAGEPGCGDVAAHAKRANPDLAAILDRVEGQNRRRLALPDVAEADRAWLKFADRFAAVMHVWQTNRAHFVADASWAAEVQFLRQEAARLGVGPYAWFTLPIPEGV
jgi:5'-deoxynucleotidase